jgi:Subtilisin inhibitor-like
MGMTSELQQGIARGRGILARGLPIAACGILAAACGSTAAPSSPGHTASSPTSSAGTPSAGTASAAKVSLDVVLSAGPNGTAKRWTLTCEPAGGTYPDPAAACGKLLQLKTILNPAPVRVMCPMIMADARSYLVYGTFLGQKVHESIVDGGCQISRWHQLNQIFN